MAGRHFGRRVAPALETRPLIGIVGCIYPFIEDPQKCGQGRLTTAIRAKQQWAGSVARPTEPIERMFVWSAYRQFARM
jgi:hypothetical protein